MKADALQKAEGSSPGSEKASAQETTGVEERGMLTKGLHGNLGEPPVSLGEEPEDEEYRNNKRPGASGCYRLRSKPSDGTQIRGSNQGMDQRATSEGGPEGQRQS